MILDKDCPVCLPTLGPWLTSYAAESQPMKSRLCPYVIGALIATVLTMLPSAMWADIATPMDDWENWYWKGQPHPRPEFSLDNPPALLRLELLTYRILVTPPAYARRAITGWPTSYASLWVPPYRETAGVPPLAMALEHAAWSFPLWLLLFALIYEVVRYSKRPHNKGVAPAAASGDTES